MNRWPVYAARMLVLAAVALSGCAHKIAFQDAGYTIQTQRRDTGIVAVIDQDTLNKTVSIRSFMTGIAHSWDAQPGQMLKQVADIELPQMFEHYEFASRASPDDARLVLEMTVPGYAFADFHATITVRTVAYASQKKVLFDKTYTEQGQTQGSKMFWAGAFGMKSAVRQSSLAAYKKIFAAMRHDLTAALESRSPRRVEAPEG